jgi:multisubunit Na+/H+ antiporter MnhF subunit
MNIFLKKKLLQVYFWICLLLTLLTVVVPENKHDRLVVMDLIKYKKVHIIHLNRHFIIDVLSKLSNVSISASSKLLKKNSIFFLMAKISFIRLLKF